MAKIGNLNHEAWAEWVATRPSAVKVLCDRLPPDRLYRMKPHGQRVTIHSYSENGTLTVDISGQYNLHAFDRQVFGINPDDLEECDLPAESEPVGTLLTTDAEIDAHIQQYIAELHQRGEEHNTENCQLCSANDSGGEPTK